MKVLKEPAGVPPAPDPRAKANAKAKTGKQMAVGWKKIEAEPEEDDHAEGEEEEPKEDDAIVEKVGNCFVASYFSCLP